MNRHVHKISQHEQCCVIDWKLLYTTLERIGKHGVTNKQEAGNWYCEGPKEQF